MAKIDTVLTPASVIRSYQNAKDRRRVWESHWHECYDYALPLRAMRAQPGSKTTDKLFDGTAPDAVDQLAASLLASLTPPWSKWVGLMPGTDVNESDLGWVAPKLEKISTIMQTHFDRSNFSIEIHQCFLDLVTAGTACLMLEESPLGEASAFQFTAVPLFDVVFEDSAAGRLDGTLRRLELTTREFNKRYPDAEPIHTDHENLIQGEDTRVSIIEAVIPTDHGYSYMAVVEPSMGLVNEATMVSQGHFSQSPFINFRWLKAPGEIYGRSPIMKALPDIKTANKVVELVLKNASIAVTGIWQAEDDGVLNPANIKLVPGAIIPKAVGSKGLTPLTSPTRFDTSNIILDDLRTRIRSALMVDKLGSVNSPTMSATEVLERSADTARILGATYGRLQSELLNPLIDRAMSILRRRGEIPAVSIDGKTIDVDYKSPLARRQSKEDAQSTLLWLNTIQNIGAEASMVINAPRVARWLARSFGVPDDLVLSESQMKEAISNRMQNTKLSETPAGNQPSNSQLNPSSKLSSLADGTGAISEVPLDQAISPLDTAKSPQTPETPYVTTTNQEKINV